MIAETKEAMTPQEEGDPPPGGEGQQEQPLLQEEEHQQGGGWCPQWLSGLCQAVARRGSPTSSIASEPDIVVPSVSEEEEEERQLPVPYGEIIPRMIIAVCAGVVGAFLAYKIYLFLPSLFRANLVAEDSYVIQVGLSVLVTACFCNGLKPFLLPHGLVFRDMAMRSLSTVPGRPGMVPRGIVATVLGATCIGVGMALSGGTPETQILQLGLRFHFGLWCALGSIIGVV